MKQFFKIVLASLLALVIFSVIGMLILIGIVSSAASVDKPFIGSKAVLVLSLDRAFKEQYVENPLNALLHESEEDLPSLYETICLIQHAKTDSAVKGIYIQCAENANSLAASEEIRLALEDFKKSGKFVVAYGEVISQKGYYLGSVADAIYCHPQGGVEWSGFSSNLFFLKGMLEKLDIQPQIFYAGKFKSATEPLREYAMTDANKLQTSVWLEEMYAHFLYTTARSRKKDSAQFRSLAVTGAIQTARDAKRYGLVDDLKYDDELKTVLLNKLNLNAKDKINFVSLGDYKASADYKKTGEEKIALVFADGDIVSGEGDQEKIGSDEFKKILRKIRLDKDVTAVVFRVNSPGGSALASDVIWREISLLRKEKPVVVSMGSYAASGGYYISCTADSIFADANTITGSIGVFSVIPNMQSFFKNKLGVTFDGVKTAPYADMGDISKPLTEKEKIFLQSSVDTIYHVFKTRVSNGRKLSMFKVDSLAQGRVWTGRHAIKNGLADRVGTLQDAINCAVKMAGIKDDNYKLREYPEKKTFIEQIMKGYKKSVSNELIDAQLGPDAVKLMKEMKEINLTKGMPQAKMPFLINIQ